MKPRIYIFVLCITFIALAVGCKDNSSGPGDPPTASISGTIMAPDSNTPIPGATVYVPKQSAGKQSSGMSAAADCPEPTEAYEAFTCTESDGSFTFTVPVTGGSVQLTITKGAFSFQKTVQVDGDEADVGDITMPSASELGLEMAVVTGSYDRMQDILAKLGFGEIETDENAQGYGFLVPGTEQFDLYDGNGSLDSSYPHYLALFEDDDGDGNENLFNYDIVFINCGAGESPLAKTTGVPHRHESQQAPAGTTMLDAEQKQALRTFVEEGGVLYATDWAYDYVEQVFPSYIDYMGSSETAAADPEDWNAAQTGDGGITVDADVLQASLESWLATVTCNDGQSCLNSDNTIHITDFLSAWVVMDGPHSGSGVTNWVEGDVSWSGGSGIQPLTASFDAGDGTVVYSSYHTVESEHSPFWRPQERILQFLVFE